MIPVFLAGRAYVGLRLLGLGQTARNSGRRALGVIQGIHELLIVQYVALGLEQHLQDLVLDGLQLVLVTIDRLYQLVALLLQVRPLQPHHVAQDLVLEARLGHAEVDDRHLDAHLGQVVGVGHLARHVEAEVRVVLDVTVAQADEQAAA